MKVDGVRKIGEHREKIADCESGEDEVSGRRCHASVSQNDDVEYVRHDPEHAHRYAQVAVHARVPAAESYQRRHRRFVIGRRYRDVVRRHRHIDQLQCVAGEQSLFYHNLKQI